MIAEEISKHIMCEVKTGKEYDILEELFVRLETEEGALKEASEEERDPEPAVEALEDRERYAEQPGEPET